MNIPLTITPGAPVYFAAVGDVHDYFFKMESAFSVWESKHGTKIDFVLQVGDLQACRDDIDLAGVATPQKYRVLGDFHHIWRKGKGLPRPTIFIGGNHEPFGWLDQFPDGGEIAPNLFYLGRTGAVTIAGINVIGLTGIHSDLHKDSPHPPVDQIMRRSRKLYTFHNMEDVDHAATQLGPADVLLLHEWPNGLLSGEPTEQWERWLRGTMTPADFGSEEGRLLVDILKPRWVFCGHMHHPWQGVIKHSDGAETQVICLADVPDSSEFVRFFRVEDGEIHPELP